MKKDTRLALEQEANDWLSEHEDGIEIFETFIPFDCAPEGVDPKNWAAEQGPESDDSIGFEIVDLTTEHGVTGSALITVQGNSWEGLRVFLGGVFNSPEEAREDIENRGVILS